MSQSPSRPPLAIQHSTARLGASGKHLTDEQRRVLDQFKHKLKATDHYTDEPSPSHADETLLRFLRARKWDVGGALKQFVATEDWRRKNDADRTFDEFPVDEFEWVRSSYPMWTGRRDRAGIPLYVFEVDKLDKDNVKRYAQEKDRMTKRMIAIYEVMLRFVLPFTTSTPHSHPDIPITGTTTIVDIQNVSLSKFWSLRSHLQTASALATANYPETISAVFVVGAPSFFGKVWDWIKGYFDEGTRNKVFILNDNERNEILSKFVDPKDLPRKYGGEFDWEYGERPSLDEQEQKTLGYERLPKGSIRWIDGKLVVLGTQRSQEELDMYKAHLPGAQEEASVSENKQPNGHVPNGTAAPAAVSTNGAHPSTQAQGSAGGHAATADTASTHSKPSGNKIKDTLVHLKDNILHPSGSKEHDVSHANQEAEQPRKEEEQHEPEHTIWDSAKENPGAPVRDLADQLQDVSLRTNVASPAAA